MTDDQTISWIFLSTALASQTEPADFKSISMVADGINHAVPTEKEIKSSMTWLINNGLVANQGKNYTLTSKGLKDYEDASKKTSVLLKIWENLENSIKKYNLS